MVDRLETSAPFRLSFWWVAFILLFLAALGVRLAGYNFSLPYLDHPDEPVFILTAREWRGTFDNGGYLDGYPPLYIGLNNAVQAGLALFNVTSMAGITAVLRLLSILFNLLTLALIVWTTRHAFSERAPAFVRNGAGMLAGLAWGFAPLVIENGGYATPDPLLYLLVTAAIAFAVRSLTAPQRAGWAVASVAAGALAILDKYYVLSAILPGLIAIVALFYRAQRNTPRHRALVFSLLIMGFTAIVTVQGVLNVPREGATARTSGLANLLNPERVLNNLYWAIAPLGLFLFIAVIVGGIAAFFWSRSRKDISDEDTRARGSVVGLSALILVTIPFLAATFSRVSATERLKDVLPATAAACILWGIAAGQMMQTLAHLPPPSRKSKWAHPARWASVAIGAAFLVFALPNVGALVQNRLLPDRRPEMRLWMNANLETGTVLVGAENHKTFNPNWGGIEGVRWNDWWQTDNFAARSIENWRAEGGMSYAVLTESDEAAMRANDAGRTFLDGLFPMNTFDNPARSSPMTFYRLWQPETPLSVHFGDAIMLIGMDVENTRMWRFYWRALQPPLDNYSLFIHLPGEESTPLAQTDGAPARAERPTFSWTDADEILISAPFMLSIPADLPAGDTRIVIGLYNYETGARLPVIDADGNTLGDTWTLETLQGTQ